MFSFSRLMPRIAISFALLTNSLAAQAQSCSDVFTVDSKTQSAQQAPITLPRKPIRPTIENNFKVYFISLMQKIYKQYGPLSYKEQNNVIQLETTRTADGKIVEGAVPAILRSNPKSTLEQFFKISDFLYSLWDAHVSVKLPSTLTWDMPLQLFNMGDMQLVNWTDNVGFIGRVPDISDEVISVNGLPTEEFRKTIAPWRSVSNVETSRAYFGMSFRSWKEGRGIPLSLMNLNQLNLELKTETGEVYKTVAKIDKKGDGLIAVSGNATNRPVVRQIRAKNQVIFPNVLRIRIEQTNDLMERFSRIFNTKVSISTSPWAKDSPEQSVSEDVSTQKGFKYSLGADEPLLTLPKDFKAILPPPALAKIPQIRALIDFDALDAGIFERDGKKVGYLRLKDYSPDNLAAVLPALRYYIKQLQDNADYLMIDQVNNPGGYVIFSDWVIKSMVGKYDPDKHLRFAVKPSTSFLDEYQQMINQVAVNKDQLFTPAEVAYYKASLQAEYDKILKAYNAEADLSEPVNMTFMSEYMERVVDKTFEKMFADPARAQVKAAFDAFGFTKTQVFKKRIYMVINSLCFSGGDATPANAQDYGAATIVGMTKNSAGAGGTVEEFENRGLIEMIIHLTTSLMVRFNGRKVEQKGVTADIVVPMQRSDLRDKFGNYFERLLTAISADFNKNGQRVFSEPNP